ncbi:TIGR03086 family protein [Kineococcus sp. R8]|nr:TIGR03086 family protein [Kineococcus siccus]
MQAALDLVGGLVDVVGPADLDRPTPCTEFTVRDLLSHLVAVTHRVAHMAGGGDPGDRRSLVTGVPDDAWPDAFRTGAAALTAAWADDEVLGRTLIHPAGPMPAPFAGFAYVQELTAHAGDLAVAVDREDLLDEDLAEAALASSRQFLPAEPRGGPVPFGPVVDVPADAPAHVRLAGWLGRG